jgi:hypothetical protein
MMRLGVQRLWGGIHIEPGDFVGRRLGRQVGLAAVERTKSFFAGTVAPMPRDSGECNTTPYLDRGMNGVGHGRSGAVQGAWGESKGEGG